MGILGANQHLRRKSCKTHTHTQKDERRTKIQPEMGRERKKEREDSRLELKGRDGKSAKEEEGEIN